MRTVYKYPFAIADEITITMPYGAIPLHAQAVDPEGLDPFANLWALVDTESPVVDHLFYLRGTGHPIEVDLGKHISTFTMGEGALVWHLFESWEKGVAIA